MLFTSVETPAGRLVKTQGLLSGANITTGPVLPADIRGSEEIAKRHATIAMERQIVQINMAISTVKHIPGHVQTVGTHGIRRAAKKLAKSAKNRLSKLFHDLSIFYSS